MAALLRADAAGAIDAPRAHMTLLGVAGMAPVRIYAEEYGHGRPIVLLHGLGASGYMWRRVVPQLARTNRVFVLDLKGFGRSDKPFDSAYTPLDQARLVGAFLEHHRLTDVTLAGHSLGGVIALLAAIEDSRRPRRRIARLATLNAPALPQKPSIGVSLLQLPVLPYLGLSVVPSELPTALALMTERAQMTHIDRDDVAAYSEPLRHSGGAHALIQTARQLIPADPARVIALYRRIEIPTLVVACRDDQTVPASTAVELVRRLPRARLAMLDGCDHIPPEQKPDEVARLLDRWR